MNEDASARARGRDPVVIRWSQVLGFVLVGVALALMVAVLLLDATWITPGPLWDPGAPQLEP